MNIMRRWLFLPAWHCWNISIVDFRAFALLLHKRVEVQGWINLFGSELSQNLLSFSFLLIVFSSPSCRNRALIGLSTLSLCLTILITVTPVLQDVFSLVTPLWWEFLLSIGGMFIDLSICLLFVRWWTCCTSIASATGQMAAQLRSRSPRIQGDRIKSIYRWLSLCCFVWISGLSHFSQSSKTHHWLSHTE